MIIRNGKMTTWTDEIESLVQAAAETTRKARMQPGLLEGMVIRSEEHEVEIRFVFGDAVTRSREVAQEALKQGYWVEYDEPHRGDITLHLDWSKKPDNPPSNRAVHA